MSKNNDKNELMLQVVKAHTKRETPGKGGERGIYISNRYASDDGSDF